MILHAAARVYSKGWILETLVKLYKKSEQLSVKTEFVSSSYKFNGNWL